MGQKWFFIGDRVARKSEPEHEMLIVDFASPDLLGRQQMNCGWYSPTGYVEADVPLSCLKLVKRRQVSKS
jgi:hypothetical protein